MTHLKAALFTTLFASAAFAAGPVAVFVPHAINLDPNQVAAFGTVCSAEYGKASGAQVISPLESQAAIGPNGSLVEAAQALHADEYVEFTLVSLGGNGARGRLVVDAVLRNARGQEQHRATMTAEGLDDTVVACERLSLALVRRTTVNETQNRHNVTAMEARATRKPNRTGSEKVYGVKTSFGAPFGRGKYNPMGTVAFDARLEGERYFIELGVGVLIPASVDQNIGGYGGFTTELGASYYLTDGDVAPYVGGGLQPRFMLGGGPVLNLAPYAQVGLMLFRQSSTRLYVDARLAQNVLPVGYGSEQSWPTELALQVGVGF